MCGESHRVLGSHSQLRCGLDTVPNASLCVLPSSAGNIHLPSLNIIYFVRSSEPLLTQVVGRFPTLTQDVLCLLSRYSQAALVGSPVPRL